MLINDKVRLYVRSNYHWYLKSEYANGSVSSITWDSNESFVVFSDTGIFKADCIWKYTQRGNIVCSIDGKSINISDY